MKKWAIPLAAAAVIAVIAVAGAAFALSESGDDDQRSATRDVDSGESGGGNGGGIAGICLEGAQTFDDTPTEKPSDGDACILIFPTPPECADPDRPVSSGETPPDEGGQPAAPDPASSTVCTMEYPNECTATAAAKAELAARLEIKEEAIKVVSVEFVEWPDSCLGVDKTDIACAEVITPGYRIVLEADGRSYEYRTDGGARAELVE